MLPVGGMILDGTANCRRKVHGNTEADVVVPAVGRVPVAVGGPAVVRVVVPTAAAQNTVR
jgi:hypothetical protein